LDPRAQSILRAVIDEYVTTATPVGSNSLVERYGFGVSSATVRNILADLEAGGSRPTPAIASSSNRSSIRSSSRRSSS